MTRRRVIALDCETDPFKRARHPKPFIWGAYDGEKFLTFADAVDCVAWLREQSGAICYAHNGGKFDFHFILDQIDEYTELMLINGRLARFQLGECEMRDSYCLIPVPLAAYKKEKVDYSIFEAGERDKPANRRRILEYLKSDCVNLWELVTQFIDRYGLKLTQASAAMKRWEKMSNLPTPKTDAKFYNDMQPYYYGGRVQCFEAGIIDTHFKVVDINSAYPYAMLSKHPYGPDYYVDASYKPKADFYRVRCVSEGALPYRHPQTRELLFPDDGKVREYTISQWEYRAAMDAGALTRARVIESLSFVNHVDFSEYVNYFYEERQRAKAANDAAGSLFAKLFMNSLYGKFAANPENYREYMNVPLSVICGLESVGYQFAGEFGPWGLAERELPIERRRYYNVATGASITGFVRAMLYRAIASSDGVLYCDTDSLAVRRPGGIDYGDALGQWKHEGHFDRAGIAGKKLYVFRGAKNWWIDENGKTVQSRTKPANASKLVKMASKGVQLTERQLWRVAGGKSVKWVSEVPTFSAKQEAYFVERTVRGTT